MIIIKEPLGQAVLTNDYFVGLVSEAIKNCYGVAGMASGGAKDTLMTAIFGEEKTNKGVTVREEEKELVIDIHVKLMYGVSIGTIVDNIKERVTYAVEEATNLKVNRINVSVDDIVTE